MQANEVMLTIKGASELTGIPTNTLRAWESRYGIARPQRSESGYRIYDAEAIAELRRMQKYLQAGASPRLAADAVIRTRGGGPADASDRPADRPSSVAPDSAGPGTTPTGLPGFPELLDAARALDERRLGAILDEAFSAASFEHVLDAWLFPALRLVGEAWIAGDIDVTGEHLVSAAVMRRLSGLYEAAGSPPRAPRVLVGLPAGSEHEIPSLAFAIAARRAGLGAVYLGPNLPSDSWVQAATDPTVRAVVISVRTPDDVATAADVAHRILDARPDARVAVGGPGATAVEDRAIVLTGGVPESARLLADLLTQDT